MSSTLLECPCRHCHVPLLIPGRVRTNSRTQCRHCRRTGGYAGHLFDGRFAVVVQRTRTRERPNPLHRRCRRIRNSYQARIWLSDVGFVNLGLYPSLYAAKRVGDESVRRARPINALTLWQAAMTLPEQWGVSRELLPKYVHGGDGAFWGRVPVNPSDKVTLGPFPDPVTAHLAAVAFVKQRKLVAG